MNETESTGVKLRTVLLIKEGMIAILGKREFEEFVHIIRFDPRSPLPELQIYTDQNAGRYWFKRSIETSVRNGWMVLYDGEPLFG